MQKENDRLKHCWGHMQQIEGVIQNPEQHLSTAYFLVKGGILYLLTDHWGQPCDLLVIPCSRTQLLLHLSHSNPMRGHLWA